MIEALEKAILAKDAGEIIRLLSTASEEEREAAQRPLKIFWLALGLDNYMVRLVHTDLKADDIEVKKKRAQYKLLPMEKGPGKYDYELDMIAWLTWFGIAGLRECVNHYSLAALESECARIMADRRPPWLNQWLAEILPSHPDGRGHMSSSFWVLLYGNDVMSECDHAFLAQHFSKKGLPYAFSKQPEETKRVLREVPGILEYVYEAPFEEFQLLTSKDWTPVLDWLNAEGLLDGSLLAKAALTELAEPHNQTERNGCIILTKSAIGKPSAKSRKLSLAFQPQWISLLSDPQGPIAGFALEQLIQIEKAGKLNAQEAVFEVPHLFNHKPKGHARKAVALLGRLAKMAELRSDAVRGLAFALAHPAKEVQEDAITELAIHLESTDDEVIESIRLHLETIVPTLRSRLETLLPGSSKQETPEAELSASEDAAEVADRVASLGDELAGRFQIREAVEAVSTGNLAEPGSWRMNQIRVLDTYEAITPIETVEELVQVTSAAVEKCECPDTLDRVIGAISRLYKERPKHFDSLTKSLRNRACQDIMNRPMRGIVGGLFSESVARCIGAWLKDTKFFNDNLDAKRFPAGEYLWELADRLKKRTAYPLLSTPTHRGGWIDPRVWVERLREVEASGVEVIDMDLMLSLLRLTPDGRDEAWQKVANGDCSISPRMQAMVSVAIEPISETHHFEFDERWPVTIWITAVRARDPWVDLSNRVPPEEASQIPERLWRLPDAIQPSNYQWRALPESPSRRPLPIVDSEPMPPKDRDPLEQEVEEFKEAIDSGSLDFVEKMHAAQIIGQAEPRVHDGMGFLTSKLHYIRLSYAAPFVYPYQATLWPMKLDWYWSLSATCLSDRVESGASVEERYAQYLLPLLEPDRNVTPMAARALWIATASKDPNAKAMAIDVWMEITASDRCQTDMLVAAWNDVFAGGWMKLNRVAEVFTEVASSAPLSAWVTAKLFAAFLCGHDTLPRDAAKLLEVLDECHQLLGLSVSGSFHDVLSGIKSGKAKQFAKSLLAREDNRTAERSAALQSALECRLARAERSIPLVPQSAEA